jgi:DUF4097 and DUF4098 domain-containing protein YvlB
MRIRVSILAAAALALAVGYAPADTLQRTLKLAPGGRLVVDTALGAVTVTGTSEPDARVVITARQDLNDLLTFRFDEEPGLARIVARSRHLITFSHGEVRFEIQVPAKTRSEIRTSGGGIRLSSLEDSAHLDTSGGGIEVRDLTGELDAHTSGGSIRVANVRGRAKLDTSGGGIHGADLSGPVQAETSGGSVDLARVAGDIDAHSSGGGIRIEAAGALVRAETSGGGIEASFARGNSRGGTLETSGGSVMVSLDPTANLEIDASGNSVKSDLPLRVSGDFSRSRVRGTLGSGGALLKVHTSGGGVRIQGL